MLRLPKRFLGLIQEHGLKEALSRGKTYFLFRVPDSFFWTPLVDQIYKKYDKITRSELRKQAEIVEDTETEYIPFKGIEGRPDIEDAAYYRPRERFITKVEDAKLKGEYGLPLDSQNSVVLEPMGFPERMPDKAKLIMKKQLQEKLTQINRNKEEIKCGASLIIPHGDNYYHWTVESLMKVKMLEKYGEETGEYPDLIVRKDRYSWMDETLDLIDYPGEVRYWEGGVAEIENLIVPSFPDPTVEECKWLRKRMLENTEEIEEKPDKIFVTRQDAEERRIENFQEVKEELSKKGFKFITPGEHTVEEQIQLFKDAEIIIGAHGAGFTNIIYAENPHIIELIGENKVHATFSRICHVLDYNYSRIKCHSINKNLIFDTKELKNLLK
jgi:hypothetical protein